MTYTPITSDDVAIHFNWVTSIYESRHHAITHSERDDFDSSKLKLLVVRA